MESSNVLPQQLGNTQLSPLLVDCDGNMSLQLIVYSTSLGVCKCIHIAEKPFEQKEYRNSTVHPGLLCKCNVTHFTAKCYEFNHSGKALSSSSSLQICGKIHLEKGCYQYEPCTKGFNLHSYLQTQNSIHNREETY